MWNGKMAARWRGKDGDLNAGNSGFLVSNTSSELVLSRLGVGGVEMDAQSCMDHSILAIFEDSAVSSEDKSGAEEESETLLSALTEMLDSVGDDDGTLSPFDTLPDSKLLTHPELRDNSVEFAGRLRPRSKSPNATFTIKADDEMEDDCKLERSSPPQLLKQQSLSRNKKAEAEVEVFTSVSLVNLVRLMHPYCLKLRVEEEGDELRKNHTFSQEEVWKYERPSEESDEEINVVSDDEVTVGGTKEEDERGVDSNRLKSVLLNRNSSGAPPSREKKRVSFGLVQVASFESAEKELNGTHLTSGHTSETVSLPLNTTEALVNPAGSALEPQTSSSEMNSNKAEVLLLRGETKAKSLSLQQYRQLRQQRQPLVEKQRNYITMWPCVSEPPKELTPILCLQGQNSGGPKAAHRYPDGRRSDAEQLHRSQTPGHKSHCISAAPKPQPSEAKPSTHPRCNGLKRPRTESKTFSPASLQPDVTANPNVTVPESKKSPVKKPTLLSSDPPNPVLLPLTTQTTSTTMELLNRDSNLSSTRHFPGNQNESSGSCLKRQPSSSGPKPEVSLGNPGYTTLLQEIKNKLSEIASGVSSTTPALFPTTAQIKSAPECRKPHRCHPNPTKEEAKHEPKTPLSANPDTAKQTTCPSLSSPAPVDATIPVDGTLSEVQLNVSPPEEPASTLQSGSRVQTADSGIEAPDLTSLLEQFEETQAKEESVCEKKPEPKLAASPSNLQTDGHLDRTQPVGTERASVEALEAFSTSESPGNPKTASSSQDLKTSEGADIPEPHGTEIVLSTQQDLPARRKNLPSKAIQIIEPRPLPSKKTHASLPEFPAAHTSAHMYSSVSSDHDYCGPINLTSASQRSRGSKLKDVSQTFEELQGKTNDSSAAAECKKQTSTSVLNTAVRAAVNTSPKSATQRLSEQPSTRSETGVFSGCVATEQRCGCAAEDELAPCTLPTPPPSPPARGRDKGRYRRRSPCSDSSSSSASSSSSSESPSPKRQKRRHKRSESSSSSSSSPSRSPPGRCRWSYSRSRCSRSRSRSWSQSRSPSPQVCRRQWRDVYSRRLPLIPTHHPDSSRESRKLRREHEIRIQKLKAIEERRVVYVGRIRRSMTHDELRERFSQFGDVECVSLHFRDRGDHYGFVTFYNKDDAFAAIDNGGKLRKPDELPFDICFGGRRQFCNSHYADLDANRDAEPAPAKSRFEDVDFDSLLKQAQRGVTM